MFGRLGLNFGRLGLALREGGGEAFAPEAEALFARLDTLEVPATPERQVIIDRCIKALKACGAWDKRDAYYFIGADELAWRQNWKQDAYNLTLVNTPTFEADRYVKGNGSNAAYDTNFNPTTAVGAKYQKDDCSMFMVTATDLANGAAVSYDVGNFSAWIGRHNSVPGRAVGRPQAGSTLTYANQVFPGHVAWSRSAANLWESYAHGLDHSDGGGTHASVDLNNNNFYICAAAGLAGGVNEIMAAGFGGNLTPEEHAGEARAIRRYLLDIGASEQGIVAYGDSTAFGTGATNWSTTWLRVMCDDYSPIRIPVTRGVAGYTPAQALARAQADGPHFDDHILIVVDLPASGENVATWATDIKALIAATGCSKWFILPPAQDTTGSPVQSVTDVQALLLSDPYFAGHTLDADDQAAYLAEVSDAGSRTEDNKHFDDDGQAIQAAYIKAAIDAAGW